MVSIRNGIVLLLIICCFGSTCLSDEMAIFCEGELVHDVSDVYEQGVWREFMLPEGGLYRRWLGPYDKKIIEVTNLPASEVEALELIDRGMVLNPGINRPLFVQISKSKAADGKNHVEAICVTFQETYNPPLIDPFGAFSDYKAIFFENLPRFPSLRHLELYAYALNGNDISKVVALSNLEYLGLPNNCSDEHLKIIGELKKLKFINASGTKIKGLGLKYLSKLPQLRALDLRRNQIDTGALFLLKSAKSLQTLLLSDSNVNDKDLKDLANSENLQYLTLHHTGITDESLKILCQMKNLKYISLYDTTTTQSGRNSLRQTRPGLIIAVEPPQNMSEFLKDRDMANAYAGNRWQQFQLAKYSYHNRKDLVEALKWHLVLVNQKSKIKWISKGLNYRYTENAKKTVEKIEKQLDENQIAEARRWARVYLYLHKRSDYEFEPKRKEGLPLYQYGFDSIPEPETLTNTPTLGHTLGTLHFIEGKRLPVMHHQLLVVESIDGQALPQPKVVAMTMTCIPEDITCVYMCYETGRSISPKKIHFPGGIPDLIDPNIDIMKVYIVTLTDIKDINILFDMYQSESTIKSEKICYAFINSRFLNPDTRLGPDNKVSIYAKGSWHEASRKDHQIFVRIDDAIKQVLPGRSGWHFSDVPTSTGGHP